MKFTNLLLFFSCCAFLCLSACGSDNSAATDTSATSETAPAPADGAAALPGGLSTEAPAPAGTNAAPAPTTAAAPASGVKHYTCPKNCKGSGGDAAGTCPTCGSAYVHNQAFHGQPGNAPTPTAAPTGTSATPVTPPPSPAKNAAGVFHYTCAKGCAGGAAAAGKCASCGGELAHNAAYHSN